MIYIIYIYILLIVYYCLIQIYLLVPHCSRINPVHYTLHFLSCIDFGTPLKHPELCSSCETCDYKQNNNAKYNEIQKTHTNLAAYHTSDPPVL